MQTRPETRVASKRGPAGRRTSLFPSRRASRNAEYASAVTIPYATPRPGLRPYAPCSKAPEISTTPTRATGIASRERFDGRSRRISQASTPTKHDLQVPEHGREPRADLLDPLVPGDQVDREEHAREPGERPLLQRPRAVAAPLEPRERARGSAARRGSGGRRPSRARRARRGRGSRRTRSRARRRARQRSADRAAGRTRREASDRARWATRARRARLRARPPG